VQVTNFPSLRLELKVSVKQTYREEEGLIVALEVRQDLDHPVDHARS
jgi:hypothetical protein